MSKKLILSIAAVVCMLTVFVTASFGPSMMEKLSKADTVYACTTAEILEGQNCTFSRPTFVSYDYGCKTGQLMDSLCVVSQTKACTDFAKAVVAETGLCKIDPTQTSNVYLPDVTDFDGRYCKGEGFNLKRYNAGVTAGTGPIICSNILNALDKSTFRFLPQVITSTDVIRTISKTELADCPTGFTASTAKCSRVATPKTCDKNGEIFTGTTCTPCPTDKICLTTNPITKTEELCPNGGTLVDGYCIAENKISQISYTDGCKTGYVKMYNSCAVTETRVHSLGCTYFYESGNENVKAIDAGTVNGLNVCSTGGRVDFESTQITLASDLECNGTGTAWYNYNVAFDPLVCGSIFTSKATFKWTAQTYSKITELHKIPTTIKVCPYGWTEMSETKCKQLPIKKEYRDCTVVLCGSSSSSSSSSTPASSSSSSMTSSNSSSSSSSSFTQNSSSSSSSLEICSTENPILPSSSCVCPQGYTKQVPLGSNGLAGLIRCLPMTSSSSSSSYSSSIISSSSSSSSTPASSSSSSMTSSNSSSSSSIVSSSSLSSTPSSSSSSSSANTFQPIVTECRITKNGSVVAIVTNTVSEIWTSNGSNYFYSEYKIENKTNQTITNWYINHKNQTGQLLVDIWGFSYPQPVNGVYQFTAQNTYWNSNILANSTMSVGGVTVNYQGNTISGVYDCGINENVVSSSSSSSIVTSSSSSLSSVTPSSSSSSSSSSSNCICVTSSSISSYLSSSSSSSSSQSDNNNYYYNNTTNNNWYNYVTSNWNNWYNSWTNQTPAVNVANNNVNTNTNTNNNRIEIVETVKKEVIVVPAINSNTNQVTVTDSNSNNKTNTNTANTSTVTDSNTNSSSNTSLVRTGGLNVITTVIAALSSVILAVIFVNKRNTNLLKDIKVS